MMTNRRYNLSLGYTLAIYFVSTFGILEVSSSLSTATGQAFYSSCSSPPLELNPPQVPNIVFAQTSFSTIKNYTCNNTELLLPSKPKTITWYYHANLPPPTNCCCSNSTGCYNITTSTYETTAYTYTIDRVGGNMITLASGTITSGAYSGLSITRTIVDPLADSTKCQSLAGLEAMSGSSEFIIAGGPTCIGIHYQTFCPGLHFE